MNPLFATWCYLQNKQGRHKRQSFSLLSLTEAETIKCRDGNETHLKSLSAIYNSTHLPNNWVLSNWANLIIFFALIQFLFVLFTDYSQFYFLLHSIQLMVFFVAKIIDMITSYSLPHIAKRTGTLKSE